MEKIEKSKVESGKEFLKEANQEIKRVTWPTRQQTVSSTWVVIAVVFLISMFLGLADFALSKFVKYILS